MIKWLPIAGAPMDETRVFVFPPTYPGTITVASYNPDSFSKNPRPYWCRRDTESMRVNREMWPTHYAPIPEWMLRPPKIELNGGIDYSRVGTKFSDDTYQDRLDSEIREECRNG